MENKMTSPRPWKYVEDLGRIVDAEDYSVIDVPTKELGEMIVSRINAHDKLVGFVKKVKRLKNERYVRNCMCEVTNFPEEAEELLKEIGYRGNSGK